MGSLTYPSIWIPALQDTRCDPENIDVAHTQVAQFRCSNACVKEERHESLVPALVPRAFRSTENRADLCLRERLNLIGACRRCRYPLHRGGVDHPFRDKPAEQRTQMTVIVLDGARADGARHVSVSPPAARFFVAGCEVVKEAA